MPSSYSIIVELNEHFRAAVSENLNTFSGSMICLSLTQISHHVFLAKIMFACLDILQILKFVETFMMFLNGWTLWFR